MKIITNLLFVLSAVLLLASLAATDMTTLSICMGLAYVSGMGAAYLHVYHK